MSLPHVRFRILKPKYNNSLRKLTEYIIDIELGDGPSGELSPISCCKIDGSV